MRKKNALYLGMTAVGVAGFLAAYPLNLSAQNTVAIDADDIGGVVTSSKGPEAGVWVIAETTDLGTKMSRTVVTDDQGRYVIPDLPKGKYKVWVRGYGLVDSPKVDSEPGKQLNLTATIAPNDKAAAEYYPAIYWYAMIKAPDASQFPGTGPSGNGINPGMRTQAQYLDILKTNGCVTCHQLGNKATVTDKRNPTVNANGLIFGATENSTDMVPVFDPVKNIAYEVKLPVRDPKTPSESEVPMFAASPYFGDEKIWDGQTSPHSLYFDDKGRVMFAARIRPPANPDFCKKGSEHASAKVFPLETSGRQLEMYDPKTQKYTLINTCFPTHHV